MPTEIRYIIFTGEELIGALVAYRRRSGAPLPSGDLIRLTLFGEPDIRAELVTGRDRSSVRHRVIAGTDELLTALIMYCSDHRIPLPVNSSKFVQIMGGNLGLVVTKNATSHQIDKLKA